MHLVLISCESPDEYKTRVRPKLRGLITEGAIGNPVVAFVRPRHLEISAKGPKKAYDLVADDCNASGRRAAVAHCRLDPPTAYGVQFSRSSAPLAGHLLGIGILQDCLRGALGREVSVPGSPHLLLPSYSLPHLTHATLPRLSGAKIRKSAADATCLTPRGAAGFCEVEASGGAGGGACNDGGCPSSAGPLLAGFRCQRQPCAHASGRRALLPGARPLPGTGIPVWRVHGNAGKHCLSLLGEIVSVSP